MRKEDLIMGGFFFLWLSFSQSSLSFLSFILFDILACWVIFFLRRKGGVVDVEMRSNEGYECERERATKRKRRWLFCREEIRESRKDFLFFF
jgi:hypothetical protein